MSEQKRQEDMKELAKQIAHDSSKYINWEYCNFERNWEIISNYLSDKGEILMLLSIGKENDLSYIIVTDHNVYHTYSEKELKTVRSLSPLYTFEQPLTKESAKILTYKYIHLTLFKPKTIEDFIRTIPGSYKNGAWRQLNGFFGLYINHETERVCVYPPELE